MANLYFSNLMQVEIILKFNFQLNVFSAVRDREMVKFLANSFSAQGIFLRMNNQIKLHFQTFMMCPRVKYKYIWHLNNLNESVNGRLSLSHAKKSAMNTRGTMMREILISSDFSFIYIRIWFKLTSSFLHFLNL